MFLGETGRCVEEMENLKAPKVNLDEREMIEALTHFARWLNSIFTCLCQWQKSIVLWTCVLFEAWAVVWKTVWICYLRQEILLWETKKHKILKIKKIFCQFDRLTQFVVCHYFQSECCSSAARNVQRPQVHPFVPLLFLLWFLKILFGQHFLSNKIKKKHENQKTIKI